MGKPSPTGGRRRRHRINGAEQQLSDTLGVSSSPQQHAHGGSSGWFYNRHTLCCYADLLAVLFGANMSFATPFRYQTNLLILSAGEYRFSAFFRVGMPLAIIMWLDFSIVLPLLYDLG